MMLKDKRASVWGLENFGSLVLAILALVALGFLAVKLYGLFIDQDKKNAQAFINSLSSKIEALEDGQNNTFALRGVEDWILVGWNKSVPIAKIDYGELISLDRKPPKCFDKACLCICQDFPSKCQDSGYCREVDRDVSILTNTRVFIWKFKDGQKDYLGNQFTPCHSFLDNLPLTALNINKQKDYISVLINREIHDSQLLREEPFGCPYSYSGYLEGLINKPSERRDNIK